MPAGSQPQSLPFMDLVFLSYKRDLILYSLFIYLRARPNGPEQLYLKLHMALCRKRGYYIAVVQSRSAGFHATFILVVHACDRIHCHIQGFDRVNRMPSNLVQHKVVWLRVSRK